MPKPYTGRGPSMPPCSAPSSASWPKGRSSGLSTRTVITLLRRGSGRGSGLARCARLRFASRWAKNRRRSRPVHVTEGEKGRPRSGKEVEQRRNGHMYKYCKSVLILLLDYFLPSDEKPIHWRRRE